ncbi:hypothetical protein [Euzebya pacifica]
MHESLPVTRVLAVSMVASVIGLAGAKVYYVIVNRDARRGPAP